MAIRLVNLGLFVALFPALVAPGSAESTIPGAPSKASPRVTDVTDHAEGISDRVGTFFDNVDMWTNYSREEKIKVELENYLKSIGAQPTLGEVHLFYVQAFSNDNGLVELKDFQYLTHGKTSEDALRETFAMDHAPGTEDKLYGVASGMRLVGIYVTATPEDGKFAIRGGPLSKEYYQKFRQEGLALREKRAQETTEAQRIDAIRRKRAAAHAASNGEAVHEKSVLDHMPPSRPGPALSPPGPPQSGPGPYRPPTLSPAETTMNPVPAAAIHPPVPFGAPPPAPPPAQPRNNLHPTQRLP